MQDDKTLGFLLHYENVPWERGKHDCVMFIQKFTDEVHNQTFFYPEDYPYHDFKTAYKAYKSICRDHEVDTFEGVLDHHYYRTQLPIQSGLVAKVDREGLTGWTYGVCYNGFGFFVDTNGLEALELNPTTDLYWSVR